MQKNISITIGGVVFHIEEAAYALLQGYLDAIRERFGEDAEGEEIVADIENRIAERFLASSSGAANRERIIRAHDVEELIKAMGRPEDLGEAEDAAHFGDSESSHSSSAAGASRKGGSDRKFYRNPDDALIGGVASGLAAYFGIEPVVVRLLFLVTLFFGGFGVLLYIILLVIVPEAKTPTEKLRMRGKAVTLDSVDRVIRESVATLKKHAPRHETMRSGVRSFAEGLRRVIMVVVRAIGAVIGFFVSAISFVALLAASFVLVVGLSGSYVPYFDFPLPQAIGWPLFAVLLVALYCILAIPFFFIFRLGSSLLRRRLFLKARLGWPLLAIWFVALFAFGTVALKIVPQYRNYLEAQPEYRLTTRDLMGTSTAAVATFDRVSVSDGIHVELSNGPARISAEGREADLAGITATVSPEGMLELHRTANRGGRPCFLCGSHPVTVTVALPDLAAIDIQNGSSLNADVKEAPLQIGVRNGAFADVRFATSTKPLVLDIENGARLEIAGAAKEAVVTLRSGAWLEAGDLSLRSLVITAENGAGANVAVSEHLTANVRAASRVRYTGEPMVDGKSADSDAVRPRYQD